MSYQEALAALGDGTRRAIFEAVSASPAPVGSIAQRFTVSRPAVSQHLRILKEAGLVRVEREGNRSIYRVDPAGLEELRRYLERFWDTALASFKEAVDSRRRM
jgi:DNA-binding transcriptional ArsR family regulator